MSAAKLNIHAKSLFLKHRGEKIFKSHSLVPASEFLNNLVSFDFTVFIAVIKSSTQISAYFPSILTCITALQSLFFCSFGIGRRQQVRSILCPHFFHRRGNNKSQTNFIRSSQSKSTAKGAIFLHISLCT